MGLRADINRTKAYLCLDCGVCTGSCPVSRYNPAYSPRLTVDSWLAASGCFALSIMAMYLLILGLFIPASMIERDARLRKFLADIGVNSILAVRLVGVIMALAAAALVVFGLI